MEASSSEEMEPKLLACNSGIDSTTQRIRVEATIVRISTIFSTVPSDV